MRSNTSLLGRVYYGSPYRLDILTKILRIIFNENLFPCSPCDPWIKKHPRTTRGGSWVCQREGHPMVKPRAESTAVMVVKAMLMMTLHLFLES